MWRQVCCYVTLMSAVAAAATAQKAAPASCRFTGDLGYDHAELTACLVTVKMLKVTDADRTETFEFETSDGSLAMRVSQKFAERINFENDGAPIAREWLEAVANALPELRRIDLYIRPEHEAAQLLLRACVGRPLAIVVAKGNNMPACAGQ